MTLICRELARRRIHPAAREFRPVSPLNTLLKSVTLRARRLDGGSRKPFGFAQLWKTCGNPPQAEQNRLMDAWQKVLSVIETKVNPQSYTTWFRPTRLIRQEGRAIWVRVPNSFFRDWLNRHIDVVIDAARDAGMQDVDVVYVVEPRSTVSESTAQGRLDFDSVTNTLNPKYVFDTFVVGSSNQFAHAAAQAVAERPSKAYNPLFLYGGVGLGKTHLMHAIGHAIKDANKSLQLAYLSTEKFTNEVINAIRYDRLPAFRERYRNHDVLLIDDMQFIAGKERTQEEFFHTFNALYDRQKQIVISADCPPREIPTLEERLHSRFEWGLIADVQPPDLETKVAILRRNAERQQINLPDNVALYIASKVKSNVRELEGALIRLIAFAGVRASDISLPLAQETLQHLLTPDDRPVSVEMIQKTVCGHFQLRLSELKSRNNARSVTLPRQICMYLCKQLTRASLPQIGRQFGGKHHTTVLHSVSKICQLRQKDPELDNLLRTFEEALRS
jgi:chromosomal replication initiator protein